MTDDRVLIANGTVLTMDSDYTVLRNTDVLIDGGKVKQIGSNLDRTGADVLDATDAIVMPGLIDSHMHMWEHPWRGLTQRHGGPRYLKMLDGFRERYTPEDTYDAILGCGLEMINYGVTGVVDFFHGANATSEHASAALEAHRRTGQRVQFSYGANASYEAPLEVFESARMSRIADFDRFRGETSPDSLVQVGLALPTPSEKLMDTVADEIRHARAARALMTFHQNRPGEITALYERGLLGSDILPVHSNMISDRELGWMAQVGMPLSITPQTEVSGSRSVSVIRRALLSGVPLSVGVDTPPSITPLELFSQLRLLYWIVRLHDAQVIREESRYPLNPTLDEITTPFERVLAIGTVGGAHALGLTDRVGRIQTGAEADVIIVRPKEPDVALRDPAAHLVLSPLALTEVESVIVGGVVRKRDGHLVEDDREGLERRLQHVRRRVLAMVDE